MGIINSYLHPNRLSLRIFLFISLIFLLLVQPALAQQETELRLRLSRDFGFSSGTGLIQGTFSMRVSGPDDLERVVFYIDEQSIGEVGESPFNLRFHTDQYSQGAHTMHAVGYTADGRELHSNQVQAEFVSADAGWQSALRIVVPILVIVGAIMLLSFVFMFISGGKLKNLPPGTPRNYGTAGGAICPRCQRPYARHFLAPNMLVGKLGRCPFCGKWAILRARPLDELRLAERAELEAAGGTPDETGLTEEQRLQRDLDQSRYQDF